MSELMRPLPFDTLMTRALTEYRDTGAVFGVHRLYRHPGGKTLPMFSERLETPFGPAAGPHTQLAQNIVAAYVSGARFFELKTVQTLDGPELAKCIARPCISAAEEGYNVEWSTELTVPQALDEYIKADFAIKLLCRELSLGEPDGFVMNMSVGYDLKGVRSSKIDGFIETMRDASGSECRELCTRWALEHLRLFERIDEAYVKSLCPSISGSITLSTLHGCPSDEIERIAAHLIQTKKLHTFIKCNPTLLGYDFARGTLDAMGYDELVFDDHHFRDDLQYRDAVPMMKRLIALAKENGVSFGVKLTNTFPVGVAKGELPGDEMYMSGKALYPLTTALAAKLEADFEGALRVSYSGGADAFNIRELYRAGIWPITLATTLLKPGGYNRLCQIAETFTAEPYAPFAGVDVAKIRAIAESARHDKRCARPVKPCASRKLTRKAPLTDCSVADCAETCPIHQDIPAYLRLAEQKRWTEALQVICERNPLPFMTGTLCTHRCQSACARTFYEEPVRIRETKHLAAEKGMEGYLAALRPPVKTGRTAAIVGGGPGGMAAAFFAARAGAEVTLFERRNRLGGVPRYVIPAFRIGDEDIDRDAKLLEAMGVRVRLGVSVEDASQLAEFDAVIAAIGAPKHASLQLEAGEALNALDFLESAKADPAHTGVSGRVVVIGGGNTAMDAARAALRLPGVTEVTIVYRRQARQMPAELDELELAMGEGVRFRELLNPRALRNGELLCDAMRLGSPGADGRRSPEPTGETISLPTDALIAAIGEKPDAEALRALGARAVVIGDARRGPATIVEAIADAAEAVALLLGDNAAVRQRPIQPERLAEYQTRHGTLCAAQSECDASRCLGCDTLCENCVDVCPNRANAVVCVSGRRQVLHIDRLCNECGNCAVFCPYAGEPYRDKLTLFAAREDFLNSPRNQGFLPLENGRYLARLNDETFETTLEDGRVPAEIADILRAVAERYPYLLA